MKKLTNCKTKEDWENHFFTQYHGCTTIFKPMTDFASDWWKENIHQSLILKGRDGGGYAVDSEDVEKIIHRLQHNLKTRKEKNYGRKQI